MTLHEIGNSIKQYRKDANITQEELASSCGISRVTLGKIERCELAGISLKNLDIVINTLGYEIEFVKKNNFGLPSLDQLG
jgi:transcriptional regulator with XRE-family HTH domain